jgi:hypothetical protein
MAANLAAQKEAQLPHFRLEALRLALDYTIEYRKSTNQGPHESVHDLSKAYLKFILSGE